jgi:exodeoxyribonuclease V alpha subunit
MEDGLRVIEDGLYRLLRIGIISSLDLHFAKFVVGLSEDANRELSLSAALVSSATRQGHTCLDLSTIAEKVLSEDDGEPFVYPELHEWCDVLLKSHVVGRPGDYKPLILDRGCRLYLFRYWEYQERLAELIRRRVHAVGGDVNISRLKDGLSRLFPETQPEGIDWQQVAAYTSVMKRFSVISGGPGTGKTNTVARILALLIEQSDQESPRIALCSPTGKGAARLQEAIQSAKRTMNCPESVKAAIPNESSTIHRLLGTIPDSPYFRHHERNRFPLDICVVDEASMVDLALMSKLFQALEPQTRLILLGDKDQLASVEAGAVLGDICDTGRRHRFSSSFYQGLKEVLPYELPLEMVEREEPGLGDCIVTLTKSFRFAKDSGISILSRAVNSGDGDLAWNLVTGGEYEDIQWRRLPPSRGLHQALRERVIGGFGDTLKTSDPKGMFGLLDRFRILCALRDGPYGVHAINSVAEQILRGDGLIPTNERWYRGRPILINRNDYNLRLFNGDMGVLLQDPEANNALRAYFTTSEGRLRTIHPVRLPEHETVYAMTVHKSQGAEFNQVLVILPDRDSPVLARELIYTGITRTRENVEIWGDEAVFKRAVARHTERMSGLRDALWK